MTRKLLAAVLVLLLRQSVAADEVFTIPRENPWDTWDYPRGLINIEADGIHVRRFSKTVNAVADAGDYQIDPIGQHGDRVARTPSNQTQVDRLHDQRPDTWWKPDQQDPVEDWWVEIDLRRVVLASKIRLVFPDTTGARPFRFFSVYTSPGLEIVASPGTIYFTRVGGTVKANSSRVVEYTLSARNPANASGQYLNTEANLPFDPVRFIRFQAEGKFEGAALAEIEVETIGENVALKVEEWGGKITASLRSAGAPNLINGDLKLLGWGIEHNAGRQEGWRLAGMWFKLDMLSTFRLDRIVWVPVVQNVTPWFYAMDNERQAGWEGTTFVVSDGTPAAAIAGFTPEEGNYTYELLSEINNQVTARSWIFDLQFPSRPTRLIFWHYDRVLAFGWTRAMQLFVYHAEGYPARVAMTSDFIDFGSARSISRVAWDAAMPSGTDIAVQTKTGNTFEVVKHFFAKQGTQQVEVAEEKYKKLPKVSQGSITEETRPGTDWSDWSDLHRFSGSAFLSPTPRRYLQARLFLTSEDPQAMPVLRNLSLVYNPPLVANGLTGQVLPRQAGLDSLESFRYTVWPQYSTGDRGFDQILLRIPAAVQDVRAVVRGQEVAIPPPTLSGDSLLVQLPQRILRDSVEISFQTRLTVNPTVFSATVMNSTVAGVWQGVVARNSEAEKVYVPGVYEQDSYFHHLVFDKVFTPNGDRVNDTFGLSLNLVRATRPPQVWIHRLDGAALVELRPVQEGVPRLVYAWDGRDAAGAPLAPGLYLLSVRLDTDAGEENLVRSVCIAY